MAVLKDKRILGIALLAAAMGLLVGSLATYGVMQWRATIRSTAQLKLLGVGVYKDVNFSVPITDIDFGILEPGQNKSISAYIKNESNVPITLTMFTQDWTPANASSFISLSWNCEGSHLDVDNSLLATFVLSLSPATTGFRSFSFTIVIVGSG